MKYSRDRTDLLFSWRFPVKRVHSSSSLFSQTSDQRWPKNQTNLNHNYPPPNSSWSTVLLSLHPIPFIRRGRGRPRPSWGHQATIWQAFFIRIARSVNQLIKCNQKKKKKKKKKKGGEKSWTYGEHKRSLTLSQSLLQVKSDYNSKMNQFWCPQTRNDGMHFFSCPKGQRRQLTTLSIDIVPDWLILFIVELLQKFLRSLIVTHTGELVGNGWELID